MLGAVVEEIVGEEAEVTFANVDIEATATCCAGSPSSAVVEFVVIKKDSRFKS